MIKIEGKNGISATIIADSINNNNRMTTFELEYPRWILAEVDTHRMLSKNTASSRAIPSNTLFDMIETKPAEPVHWGVNQAGMTSKEELHGINLHLAQDLWKEAAHKMLSIVRVLSDKTGINGHKQWVNRLIENFTMSKTVISGTEWTNFFWLRNHPDAQPEFKELASVMYKAYTTSVPTTLSPGEWHLPYIVYKDGKYWVDEETDVDLDTARKVSVSCCAQVSYRKLDDSVEKAKKIFEMLNIGSTDKPQHVSPCEHQATPMDKISYEDYVNLPHIFSTWQEGITSVKRDSTLWSGNLQGWIQYRQLIQGNTVW